MFIFLFLCSLLVPLSMTFLGYTWKDNPPKESIICCSNYYVKNK